MADDGTETEILETGTADLWFASDLPFSWVPFAVPPASPGHAFPLAHSWPEVASAVIGRYGAQLEGLGLLLRARVKDEIRPGESPAGSLQFASMDSERSLSVSDVAAASQPPDAGSYAELPQITHPRMAVLELALFLLEPCASLESAGEGTFEFATSGRRSYLASGSGALFLTDDGVENSSVVVAGTVREGSAECTVIMLPGDGPREGTFAVASPNSRFAQPALDGSDGTDTAIGLHALAGESGLQRILVFDGGQVRIERADAEAVSGKVEAKAWVLELDPRYPHRLFEDLAVELTFEAVPGTRAR